VGVTEILNVGREYGREFMLVIILLTGMGVGLTTVYDSFTARIIQQNERIDKADAFIRTELVDVLREQMAASEQCADALKANAQAFTANAEALRENTRALDAYRARMGQP
jgi:cell division protein FtsB